MAAFDSTTASLWLAVAGSGLYHGLNPGMGWPLAVSAGLMAGDPRRGRRDLLAALGPLALGHLAAMAAILMPFAALAALVDWQREIRLTAGLAVIATGFYLFVNRRHPRFLARIRPGQLVLWSFAVATAHGAGLMLVPIYLGLCRPTELDAGHAAAAALMSSALSTAVVVALVHAAAMIAAGGALALAVHGWLGPQFIARSWFNLDAAWAVSLVLVGAIGLADAAGLI